MTSRFLTLFGVFSFLLFSCKSDDKKNTSAEQQIDPVLAALNTAIEQNPDNDSLLYRRAVAYYKLEGYDEAIRDAAQAIRLDSVQPAYYHLMADILLDYARPNDSRRAIDVLQTAASKFPDDLHTLLKLSEFQLIVRQHGEALATLDKVLRRDPQNAEAFYMAGRVALDKGDTTAAVASLQKSVKFDAGNDDAWMFLGRIFVNRNNPQAIQYFDNALRIDSTNLEAREFQGVYYKKRGEFDKAFAVYRDIIAQNPDYSNAYFDMGAIYLEQDSLARAYDNFDIALKTDPLFVKAYYYRGLCSEMQGNREAALADYRQANKMSPDYAEPKAALERMAKKAN